MEEFYKQLKKQYCAIRYDGFELDLISSLTSQPFSKREFEKNSPTWNFMNDFEELIRKWSLPPFELSLGGNCQNYE